VGELLHRHIAIGRSLDEHDTLVDVQIGHVGFHDVRSDLQESLANVVCRTDDGTTADNGAATRERPHSVRGAEGVTLEHPHVLEAHDNCVRRSCGLNGEFSSAIRRTRSTIVLLVRGLPAGQLQRLGNSPYPSAIYALANLTRRSFSAIAEGFIALAHRARVKSLSCRCFPGGSASQGAALRRVKVRSGVADAEDFLDRLNQLNGLERLGEHQMGAGALGGCKVGGGCNRPGFVRRDAEVATA
jgi:hypothetical protein